MLMMLKYNSIVNQQREQFNRFMIKVEGCRLGEGVTRSIFKKFNGTSKQKLKTKLVYQEPSLTRTVMIVHKNEERNKNLYILVD